MKASDQSFIAFFSYVRRNDEHDRGKITDLRKLLEAELWAQTGKDLKIFQDTEDIPWGADWKEQIIRTLRRSTFLIVVLTPGYLESQSCRFEFEYYLKLESQLKRKLILPILYIDTPRLKDTNDEIAIEISKRQWIDWTHLRFTSLTSAKANKSLALLAKQIRDLISDETANAMFSRKESKFPPNSLLSKITDEKQQANSIDFLPSLYALPAQEEKQHPPQQITVILRSTGAEERDRWRIKAIYGTLISFHGNDHFSFHIFENDKGYLIDFPDDTTRVCSELLERLKKLMGEEKWRVEEIMF